MSQKYFVLRYVLSGEFIEDDESGFGLFGYDGNERACALHRESDQRRLATSSIRRLAGIILDSGISVDSLDFEAEKYPYAFTVIPKAVFELTRLSKKEKMKLMRAFEK